MDQKTLKLDNLIDKMDRLKVPWSPKPDGDAKGDTKGDAKGGSTIADVRNLRARNGEEFDTPNPPSDHPRQTPRYQASLKRPSSAAPPLRK